jgi:hypothetical protein
MVPPDGLAYHDVVYVFLRQAEAMRKARSREQTKIKGGSENDNRGRGWHAFV